MWALEQSHAPPEAASAFGEHLHMQARMGDMPHGKQSPEPEGLEGPEAPKRHSAGLVNPLPKVSASQCWCCSMHRWSGQLWRDVPNLCGV